MENIAAINNLKTTTCRHIWFIFIFLSLCVIFCPVWFSRGDHYTNLYAIYILNSLVFLMETGWVLFEAWAEAGIYICFRLVRKIPKTAIRFIMSVVLLPVRLEQFSSHWKDFKKFWYLRTFWKFVEEIPIWFKFEKKNGYLTWIAMSIYDNILLNYSYNEICFRRTLYLFDRASLIQIM
jgi:hypothetical protein